jgi:hypothetical protein
VATERSPFGVPLDVRYPHSDVDACSPPPCRACPPGATPAAGPARGLPGDPRPAAQRIFELANAVQFTTGRRS